MAGKIAEGALLPKWGGAATGDEPEPNGDVRYPISAALNNKVVLWNGNICALKVDALVNTTNNMLTRKTSLFQAAGEAIRMEVELTIGPEGCRTGDAVATRPCKLPSKRLFHTVGPIYKEKYRTAATSALHSCYLNCMKLLKEEGHKTIGFPCLYTTAQKFPREDAAHVALRTIRRVLEKFSEDIDLVVLAVSSEDDMEIYQRLTPYYFPRTSEEEAAGESNIPHESTNEFGDVKLVDREIRVATAFQTPIGEGLLDRKQNLTMFRAMDDEGPDERRMAAMKSDEWAGSETEAGRSKYQEYLERAMEEDFTDMDEMKIIYTQGVDHGGRVKVLFVPTNLPPKPDWDRVLLYMIKVCDSVVTRPYVLVYFNPPESRLRPELGWLRKTLKGVLTRKYKKNMQYIYVVHPSLWIKTVCIFLKPFVSSKVWKKLVMVNTVKSLFNSMTITIPEKVLADDKSYNSSIFSFGKSSK